MTLLVCLVAWQGQLEVRGSAPPPRTALMCSWVISTWPDHAVARVSSGLQEKMVEATSLLKGWAPNTYCFISSLLYWWYLHRPTEIQEEKKSTSLFTGGTARELTAIFLLPQSYRLFACNQVQRLLLSTELWRKPHSFWWPINLQWLPPLSQPPLCP